MTEESARLDKKEPSNLVAAIVIALTILGIATSGYLTHLYVKVSHAMAEGHTVNSFCNLNEQMNCDAVAASVYSVFLGVPIAVWGLEYFVAAFILAASSKMGWIGIRRWDAVLFLFSLCGVPVTIVLGCISAFVIESMCIMCLLVYVVNTLLVLVVGGNHVRQLKSFALQGIKEIRHILQHRSYQVAAAVVGVFVLSQLVWMPEVMGSRGKEPVRKIDESQIQDAKAGQWKGIVASGKTLGPKTAPILIEEFTDFECPFCSIAHDTLLKLVQKYPNKIHLIHRDFPLDQDCNPIVKRPFHPHACLAAAYARCAGEQDKFWPYEALLFHHQKSLNTSSLQAFAKKVGLDSDKLQVCVSAQRTQQRIRDDIAEGQKRDVTGTPAVFINGNKVVGVKPIEFWDDLVQKILYPPVDSGVLTDSDVSDTRSDCHADVANGAVTDSHALPEK